MARSVLERCSVYLLWRKWRVNHRTGKFVRKFSNMNLDLPVSHRTNTNLRELRRRHITIIIVESHDVMYVYRTKGDLASTTTSPIWTTYALISHSYTRDEAYVELLRFLTSSITDGKRIYSLHTYLLMYDTHLIYN